MAELQAIHQNDCDSTRMHAALDIYKKAILPEAQNPEKQIVYWIEHCDDEIKDEFRCFSVHQANDVVGYLQYSYFREEHIFFFEYLCLASRRRTGLYNKDAMDSIEDFISEHYDPGFTIAFEVAHRLVGKTWQPDKKLINYFVRLGFRKVEFQYRYPVLQSYDGETSYPADLMVRLPDGRTKISASDYRTVIRCLYFKHYLRWDRPFLDPEKFKEREKLINELYWKQLSVISGHDSFDTSGDDKRSVRPRFLPKLPSIKKLLIEIFSDKFGSFVLVTALLLIVNRVIGNPWLFVPFMLIVFASYCLLQNTPASRKLFVQIISRAKFFRLPQ